MKREHRQPLHSPVLNRREFLKTSIGAVGAGVVSSSTPWSGDAQSQDAQAKLAAASMTTQARRQQGFKAPILWSSIDDDHSQQDFNNRRQSLAAQDFVRYQNWLFDEGKNPQNMVRSANPQAKVLFYRAADIAWEWQENWGTINAHENWFKHEVSGHRIRPVNDWYRMDLANAEFRAYQIRYCTNGYVRKYNLDGLMWDGPQIQIETRADVLRFVDEFKRALGSKLLITNSTQQDHMLPRDDWLLPIVDGTVFEVAVPGSVGEGDWMRQAIQRNLTAGRSMLISHAYTNDHRLQVYWYALMLLFTDGAKVWYELQGWFEFPELRIAVGAATGPARQEGSVWTRDFTKATVRADLRNGIASVTSK